MKHRANLVPAGDIPMIGFMTLAILAAFFCGTAVCALGAAAAADAPGDLADVVDRHSSLLESVASDQDARRVFERLRGTLGLDFGPGARAAATELDGTALIAELSAWQLATAIASAADTNVSTVTPILQQRQQNLAWLLDGGQRPTMAAVVDAARALNQPSGDSRTAQLTLALAATRAGIQAERNARLELDRLRNAVDASRARRGQQRLCGTWQWTIHNHQNHQEHKVFMVFPPPDPVTPSSPRLSRMVVQGDTIYLRWDFPGGYQEESLLFGGEGQRVEGTFVNSAGAWGSITGKKAAPCKKQ